MVELALAGQTTAITHILQPFGTRRWTEPLASPTLVDDKRAVTLVVHRRGIACTFFSAGGRVWCALIVREAEVVARTVVRGCTSSRVARRGPVQSAGTNAKVWPQEVAWGTVAV